MCYNISMVVKKQTHILAFVGMPGAGVSSATTYFARKGYPRVYVGGIVYDEMRAENIEITAESQKYFRENRRKKAGQEYFIAKASEQIRHLINSGQKKIILDGLYSWAEYRFLKKEFPGEITVISIVAPRKTRHHRLANRPERPFGAQEATERDWDEIKNIEKGGPIAIADQYIVNTDSLDDLYEQLDKLVEEVRFCKAPEQC